jgi:alkylation response protein AidB-like acyl-CoA dehydrogenase
MDLSWSEEQEQLRRSFGALLASYSTMEDVRAAETLGFDNELWKRALEFGVMTMGLPDEMGGGAGLLDLAVVAQECGRHLASIPFIETVVAGRLLAATKSDLLESAVLGRAAIATLGLSPARVSEQARMVPSGAIADILLILEGDSLVAYHRSPGSPRPAVLPNLGSAPIAHWDLNDPILQRSTLLAGAEAIQAYDVAVDEWRTLTAAALDGLRQEALRIGLEYVKVREAFGSPIGAFQSVKHRLADVRAAGDGAELLAYQAAWAMDMQVEHSSALARMALLFGAEAAFKTCRESLQFHGGYGYTLEYDIQLYFRRAKAWPLAIGDPQYQYEELAVVLFSPEVADGFHRG